MSRHDKSPQRHERTSENYCWTRALKSVVSTIEKVTPGFDILTYKQNDRKPEQPKLSEESTNTQFFTAIKCTNLHFLRHYSVLSCLFACASRIASARARHSLRARSPRGHASLHGVHRRALAVGSHLLHVTPPHRNNNNKITSVRRMCILKVESLFPVRVNAGNQSIRAQPSRVALAQPILPKHKRHHLVLMIHLQFVHTT